MAQQYVILCAPNSRVEWEFLLPFIYYGSCLDSSSVRKETLIPLCVIVRSKEDFSFHREYWQGSLLILVNLLLNWPRRISPILLARGRDSPEVMNNISNSRSLSSWRFMFSSYQFRFSSWRFMISSRESGLGCVSLGSFSLNWSLYRGHFPLWMREGVGLGCSTGRSKFLLD